MTEVVGSASGVLKDPTEPFGVERDSRRDRERRDFRPDIEGLRAIAILLIVAYHAGVPGFSGGFIGVDVFFVISGYLITRHLLRDSEETGSVAFGAFWARRIRRLVPGLALTVVVTLIAGLALITPFDMLETAKEGAASALYVSNILFGQNTQNYFGSNPNKSPFLHTWSLGVEEQFYLLWPFLVLGLVFLTRRRRHRHRHGALVLFAAIFVVSFALNLRWTGEGSSWAFFSLPTRAWEFAAGGFLGSLAIRRTANRFLQPTVGFVGLALLIGATELFNSSTTYPGVNALVPVIGTTLLILAGGIGLNTYLRSPVSRALSIGPMQWTGRLSYSWYLWHWPFIVLTVLAFNNGDTLIRTAAALASLGAAYVAFRYVENPVRFAKSIVESVGRTFGLGLVITMAVICAAGGTWVVSSLRTPSSFNAQMAVADTNFFPNCGSHNMVGGILQCYGGDLAASTTVALVGDSHAATWFNALSSVAAIQKVRILLLTEPGCPFIPIEVRPAPNGPVDTQQCLARRGEGMTLLSVIKPKAIVLTQHTGGYLGLIMDSSGNIPPQKKQVSLWEHAFLSFLEEERSLGVRPGVILDNPTLPQSPAECVSQTGSIAECEPSRSVAFASGRLLQAAELQVLAELRDVPRFNPDDVLCTATGCPLELNRHLLYADTNHLLYGATKLMEPQLSTLLRALVVPDR